MTQQNNRKKTRNSQVIQQQKIIINLPFSTSNLVEPQNDAQISYKTKSHNTRKSNWNKKQKIRYLVFSNYYSQLPHWSSDLKSIPTYKALSTFIKTRSPQQCKSFHLSLRRNFKSMQEMIKTFYEQLESQQGFARLLNKYQLQIIGFEQQQKILKANQLEEKKYFKNVWAQKLKENNFNYLEKEEQGVDGEKQSNGDENQCNLKFNINQLIGGGHESDNRLQQPNNNPNNNFNLQNLNNPINFPHNNNNIQNFPPQNKNPFALNNNNSKIISSSLGNNRHPQNNNNLTNYKGLSSAFSNIGGDNNKTNNNSVITNGNNQNINTYNNNINNNNPYTTEYEKSMMANNSNFQQQLLNNNNINKNPLIPSGGMGNISFYVPQQGNNLPLFDNNNISSLTSNGNINVSGMNNTTMDQLRMQQQQTSAMNNGLVGNMPTNLQPGMNIAGRAIGNMGNIGSNNNQQQIVDNNYKRLLQMNKNATMLNPFGTFAGTYPTVNVNDISRIPIPQFSGQISFNMPPPGGIPYMIPPGYPYNFPNSTALGNRFTPSTTLQNPLENQQMNQNIVSTKPKTAQDKFLQQKQKQLLKCHTHWLNWVRASTELNKRKKGQSQSQGQSQVLNNANRSLYSNGARSQPIIGQNI